MYDELWSEIQDAPGEIFDIPELNDEDFNLNEYINGNIDYWWWHLTLSTLLATL